MYDSRKLRRVYKRWLVQNADLANKSQQIADAHTIDNLIWSVFCHALCHCQIHTNWQVL